MINTASVSKTDSVVCSTPSIESLTDEASPVNPIPVALTFHTFFDESYSVVAAVTFGTTFVKMKFLQISSSHGASSDVFRKTRTVPFLPSS
jgi:hypothetical protein